MTHAKYKLGNKVLKIKHDENASNPREWDNLSRLIFVGTHKNLGDKHEFNSNEHYYESRQDFIERGAEHVRKYLKREEQLDVAYITPVHMYTHSGSTISTSYSGQYADRWDSGTMGFAVLTKQDIRKNWGLKRITQHYLDWAIRILESEIETLDHYIRGDVFGYVLKEDGEEIDSYWGFYGDDIKTNGILDYVGEEWAEVEEV
jgi:hypothetical protein